MTSVGIAVAMFSILAATSRPKPSSTGMWRVRYTDRWVPKSNEPRPVLCRLLGITALAMILIILQLILGVVAGSL
jgi:hypothetical protein